METVMTDLEINKALALAIGYTPKTIHSYNHENGNSRVFVWAGKPTAFYPSWRVFDYRDWSVIGPIAERYNLFPWRTDRGWVSGLDYPFADTPRRAIALAVIEARK